MVVVLVSQPLFTLSPFLLRQAHSSSSSRPPSRIRHRFSSCLWLNLRLAFNRVDSFYSRCSITNTDVCNNFATDEEIQEDFSATALNCSVPIVHLKSDILETESLNLLAVLSEEEQNAIAATLAHPAGLYALYASCLAGNLVEQLWNFAWPAAIALLHHSLLPVAVMGFCTKVAIIVGGPLVGKLMDHFPRVPAYNCLSTVQAAAQLLSVGMIIYAHTVHSTIASSVLLHPWFVVLVVAGAVERLSELALGVAMERDWVVLLAGTNRSIALAQSNAVLSRIDLLCEELHISDNQWK